MSTLKEAFENLNSVFKELFIAVFAPITEPLLKVIMSIYKKLFVIDTNEEE